VKKKKKNLPTHKTFGAAIAAFWESRGVSSSQWQLKGKKIIYGNKTK